MIKGVHTMFYSSEPEALRAFLRDKLGFPYTDVGEGWLIFDLPEADMGCHPAEAHDGQRSGTHNISFYCDDIRQTVAELRSRGVEFTDEIADAGYGLATHFKMPGDVEVQLYQPHYAKKSGRPVHPISLEYNVMPPPPSGGFGLMMLGGVLFVLGAAWELSIWWMQAWPTALTWMLMAAGAATAIYGAVRWRAGRGPGAGLP